MDSERSAYSEMGDLSTPVIGLRGLLGLAASRPLKPVPTPGPNLLPYRRHDIFEETITIGMASQSASTRPVTHDWLHVLHKNPEPVVTDKDPWGVAFRQERQQMALVNKAADITDIAHQLSRAVVVKEAVVISQMSQHQESIAMVVSFTAKTWDRSYMVACGFKRHGDDVIAVARLAAGVSTVSTVCMSALQLLVTHEWLHVMHTNLEPVVTGRGPWGAAFSQERQQMAHLNQPVVPRRITGVLKASRALVGNPEQAVIHQELVVPDRGPWGAAFRLEHQQIDLMNKAADSTRITEIPNDSCALGQGGITEAAVTSQVPCIKMDDNLADGMMGVAFGEAVDYAWYYGSAVRLDVALPPPRRYPIIESH